MRRTSGTQKSIFPADYVEEVRGFRNIDFYAPLTNDFHRIDKDFSNGFNLPKDYETNPQAYINQRYGDIFTRRQAPFSLPIEDHPHPFPAAKIDLSGNQFNVLAEGPSQTNLGNLLWGLKQVGVNAIVAVGLPFENREKFYNYMQDSEVLTAQDYFQAIAPLRNIDYSLIQNTTFKFYRYASQEHGVFYIMHIPNWDDHGLPRFLIDDKTVLAYYFSYGPNSCFHCSAGMERSVSLLLTKMVFKTIDRDWSNIGEAQTALETEFRKIKALKPGAGHKDQYCIVPGLVEEVRGISQKLQIQNNNKQRPFEFRSSVSGFPRGHEIVSDTTKMYSDHLPQLFRLKHGSTPFNLLTYNIYGQGAACGYKSYELLEMQEHEPFTLYQDRLARIAASLGVMVKKHNIHAIAIQEGITPRFAQFFLGEIKKFNFEALDQSDQWFLYAPSYFSSVEQDPEQNLMVFNQKLASGVQRIKLTTRVGGVDYILHNVRMEHQDFPDLHQEWLKGFHIKGSNFITVGDFNCGVQPFQLSGRVPPAFTEGKEAYDSTDGCVISSADQEPAFIKGLVLDPKSGEIIKAETQYPNQPDQRRYRACMNLDLDKAFNHPSQGIWSVLMNVQHYIEPNVCNVFSVHDIQRGEPGAAFLVNENGSELFDQLKEIGLLESSRFLYQTRNLVGYIVSGENAYVHFLGQYELCTYISDKVITPTAAKFNQAINSQFITSLGSLKKEIDSSPIKLCQLAKVLKDLLDPKVVKKEEVLQAYRGERNSMSLFFGSREEQAIDRFVESAKSMLNPPKTGSAFVLKNGF